MRRQLKGYPALTREQEVELVAQAQAGSIAARNQIVLSHMRVCYSVAFPYTRYGHNLDELAAEGSIGLIHAMTKFDPTLGFRFHTYCRPWVRVSIRAFVLGNSSHLTIRRQRLTETAFFDLKSGREGPWQDHVTRLAERCGASVATLERMLCAALPTVHLDGFTHQGQSIAETIADDYSFEDDLIEQDRQTYWLGRIRQACSRLTAQEQRVLWGYWLEERKFRELADEMGVTHQRVQQVLVKAMARLRTALGVT